MEEGAEVKTDVMERERKKLGIQRLRGRMEVAGDEAVDGLEEERKEGKTEESGLGREGEGEWKYLEIEKENGRWRKERKNGTDERRKKKKNATVIQKKKKECQK